MVSFAAAYMIVWLAVVLYLVRLERRQRSLMRTIESLRARQAETEDHSPPRHVTKAA
jgi:CcmD family protein